ncbi:MAG: class I SAM-dependent methyltransferase [Acidimicrobiia bacterium]
MVEPNYLDNLKAAYDADVDRRGAMDLASWRTDILDDFLDTFPERQTMLELGCGTGQMARYVADRGLTVTAIDLSPGNVEATRQRGIDAEVADFGNLPFESGSFDGAYALMSLIHVPAERLSDVFTEIRRVLTKGASLLMVVWGGERHEGQFASEWLDPPRFFSIYPDDEVLKLDFRGFTITDFATGEPPDTGDLHVQVLTLTAI